MTVDPALEAPRPVTGESFSDAITVAFGDDAAGVFGIARIGLSEGPVASGLGLLFADGDVAEVRAEGGVAAGASWEEASAGGVTTRVVEPLRSWTLRFDGEDGTLGFDLELSALSAPAAVDRESEAARLGGMEGYEQLVQVEGTVRAGGAPRRIRCLGQRGHSWGAPDWDRLSLARTVGVWLDGGLAVTMTALRPAGSDAHGDERIACSLLVPSENGGGSVPVPVADPRLSTTYDSEGRQRSAGLELYVNDEDDVPHRAAGEVLCGTTLDLGRLRLDTAFLRWRMEGHTGVGRYDVLRRT